MPNYTYLCDGCDLEFELFYNISTYCETPKCPQCKRDTSTRRNYLADVLTQFASVKKSDSELKTLGDLAKRNSDKMSNDQKISLHHKHNDYKDNKIETKPLPSGMSYQKKPPKPKWPGT